MSDNEKINKNDEIDDVGTTDLNNRRMFLKMGGAGLAALALGNANRVMAFSNPATPVAQVQQTINFGTGDIGIMNFAYLLEQLEANFYTRVVANNFYAGATAEERQILTDLRDHEIIHREFFKATLGANAIPQLPAFDFSLVDFNSRDSVLTNSQALEDTGVAAYNGAGQAIVSPDILALAGKIVSVEGRHAAAIRDLRIPRTGYFAPHPDDFALDPLEVLTLASPYIPRGITINASGLPRVIVV
ncbi:MAG TPA: ferritin-like domain-containing protein [Pyrinomonadaceae bacterium]|nr:ferritin-like domain-containing protein [Pyrinomonadaceae bacterium]